MKKAICYTLAILLLAGVCTLSLKAKQQNNTIQLAREENGPSWGV